MPHNGMHKQSPIPRENCAILRGHDLKQAAIIGFGFVKRIQSQEAKVEDRALREAAVKKSIETQSLQPRGGRKKIQREGKAIDVESNRILQLPAKIDT
jgi:hypothetical protein